MALVGAVQGGLHADLRERCARSVSSLDVAVCAIGGVVPVLEAYRFRDLVRVIIASKKGLDPSKPVHLFGAGHPLIFPLAALLGCDLFDSASYAKYARAGRMLFPDGTRRASEVRESGCLCPVCTTHPMEKIAGEETLLAEHNLHACFGAIREVRQAIVEGDLWGSPNAEPGLIRRCSTPCGSCVGTTNSWKSSSRSPGVERCTTSARRPRTARSSTGSGGGWSNGTPRLLRR